jgi:hypothetical protein
VGRPKTIDILPEDALLEIFNFFTDGIYLVERWHALVHVCQRWRWVVFASQRRLNLRLLCTAGKPVRDMLGVWPALPIQIRESWGQPTRGRSPTVGAADSDSGEGADNIIAALEHSDRVCEIVLRGAPSALLEGFGAAAARDPFPALTHLELWSNDKAAPPALPDSFLGGTAPRLRTLFLNNVAFPAVWTLLAPAVGHLVHLRLWHIPDSGYISPRLMVACLSSLTRLESLELGWRSPRSRPDRGSRRPPPLTRTVLPALAYFRFKGVSEHLEDLVARIDVPQLRAIKITLFNQLIFDTPQVLRFINHTEQLRSINRADMVFYNHSVEVKFYPAQTAQVDFHELVLKISCRGLEWQLSSLAQVCNSSLPPLPVLERLDICADQNSRPRWQDDIDNAQWMEILRPFTAVKNLHLSWALTSRVVPALQELARESVTPGVLPVLQNLFLEGLQPPGPAQKAIREFVSARQRYGHPVTVHRWERGW